jgi:hypothetical protein
MAQTTGAIAQAGFKVEVSTDGSSWTDVSGTAATVAADGGEIKVGNQHTAEGDQAVVVSSNKAEPITLTAKALYTEAVGEAWAVVDAVYRAADKRIYMRYSPAGGNEGDLRFVTAVGGVAAAVPLVSCLPPEMDAGGEDPAMFEFSVMTPGLLSEAVPAS